MSPPNEVGAPEKDSPQGGSDTGDNEAKGAASIRRKDGRRFAKASRLKSWHRKMHEPRPHIHLFETRSRKIVCDSAISNLVERPE